RHHVKHDSYLSAHFSTPKLAIRVLVGIRGAMNPAGKLMPAGLGHQVLSDFAGSSYLLRDNRSEAELHLRSMPIGMADLVERRVPASLGEPTGLRNVAGIAGRRLMLRFDCRIRFVVKIRFGCPNPFSRHKSFTMDR